MDRLRGHAGRNYDIRSIIETAGRLTHDLKSQKKLKFIIAGDGPLKGLCAQSVTDSFVFLGRLAAADLTFLYRHCDVALATYKGESTVAMPIKAFDYLRFGLPIVNSLGRDIGAFVRERQVGMNYDSRSAASLYEAISRLTCDEAFRKRCSMNARVLAREFDSDKQYNKFVSVLQRLSHSF